MGVCALLALLCLAYLPLLHASKQTAFERGVFPTARMHFPIISLGQEKNRSALDSEDANNHIRIASLARIDPDMDLFLSNPSNSPYVPMAPKIKTNKKERSKFGLITTYSVGKWFHLNGIAVLDGRKRRWRVLSRILFSPSGIYDKPDHSYIWEEYWELDLSRSHAHTLPLYAPSHHGAFRGPEDSRPIHDAYGNLCIVFNMLDANAERLMFFYNTTSKHQVSLSVPDEWERRMEKNWSPMLWDKRIIFVHSWSPLVMLTCDFQDGECEVLNKLEDVDDFEDGDMHGGTKYVYYRMRLILAGCSGAMNTSSHSHIQSIGAMRRQVVKESTVHISLSFPCARRLILFMLADLSILEMCPF